MDNKDYLLDTNILIEIIHGNTITMRNVEAAGHEHCFISIMSLYEMYYGAYNAPKEIFRKQELKRIEWLQERFVVLNLSMDGAMKYGRIKTHLRHIGRPVDEFDMIIGEQAIANGLTLVTHNIRHFRDMSGIKIVDWTLPAEA